MSYTLEFQADGMVRVFISRGDGQTLSVTTTVNQLAAQLPAADLQALRTRTAAFVSATGRAPRLKAVN